MIPLLATAALLAVSPASAPSYGSNVFGISVAGPGDLDGDGVPDLFVAAPGHRHTYLISGKTGEDIRVLPHAWNVAAPGDVDGDGISDLMLASAAWLQDTAYALVVSGKDGHEIYRYPAHHVAAAGDLNRDGRADFVVGSDVRSGKDGSLLLAVDGTEVRGAGDTNGDGTIDFVGLGSFKACVFSGRDGTTLHTFKDWKTRFPLAVIGTGDLDGDGCADIAVGYPDEECNFGIGYVRVFSGKGGGVIRDLESPDALFGATLLAPGDLDGDGHGDLVVGAYDSMGSAWGNVLVYSGRTWKEIADFWNNTAEAGFGIALATLGDVDKDGVTDLAVGACKGSAGGNGFTFIYSGRTREVLRTIPAPPQPLEGQ